jgi:hypothetical protein
VDVVVEPNGVILLLQWWLWCYRRAHMAALQSKAGKAQQMYQPSNPKESKLCITFAVGPCENHSCRQSNALMQILAVHDNALHNVQTAASTESTNRTCTLRAHKGVHYLEIDKSYMSPRTDEGVQCVERWDSGHDEKANHAHKAATLYTQYKSTCLGLCSVGLN